tara:strand:- start:60 stop:455 length:396 start_codon:yes stop_codon:yes gene_type:complete
MSDKSLNVLGKPLEVCSCKPMTGWFRNGSCNTDSTDFGEHTVCALMSNEFLTYSKAQGNDLSTPHPEYGFPGLVSGNYWCLCASRWKQAYEDGMAPLIRLEATEISVLKSIDIEILKNFNQSDPKQLSQYL